MRIMAIDYGDAHTGIAISDPTGLLAGYTTVINAHRPEAVIQQIAQLAKEYGVEELVLGHPVNMDGTLGPRSEKAHAMKTLVESAIPLPYCGMNAAQQLTLTTFCSTAVKTQSSEKRLLMLLPPLSF